MDDEQNETGSDHTDVLCPTDYLSISDSDSDSDNERSQSFKRTRISERATEQEPSTSTANITTSDSTTTIKETSITEKKINYHQLDVMKQFLNNASNDNNINHLLTNDDKMNIEEFLSMNSKYQLLIMEFFIFQHKWSNIFEFTESLNLSLTNDEIKEMYSKLSANSFIQTSYTDGNLIDILKNMQLKDLRAVGKKLNIGARNKPDIISKRSELSGTDMTDRVIDCIKKEMGHCAKLSDNCRNFLNKICLLNTFTNPKFNQPKLYFKNYLNEKFPHFEVEPYQVFYVEPEFSNYMDAIKCRLQIEKVVKSTKLRFIHLICTDAFQKLQPLIGSMDESRPHYLRQFSAVYEYISIISLYCDKLTSHHYQDVCKWLENFLSLDLVHHDRASWYNKLSLIYMNTAFKQYDRAAEIIIEAFKQNKQQFSDIQLYELAETGNKLRTKSYKVTRLYLDEILYLSPESLPMDKGFPYKIIEPEITNDSGKRRKSIKNDGKDDEDAAIDDYLKDGYTDAYNSGKMLMCTLFNLFFWDIIYDNTVPGTLISNVQMWPLDLYTEYFYKNRKQSIEQRLKDISTDWSHEDYINFAKDIFDDHSHELSICKIASHIENVAKLREILRCIDRQLLMKIFKRMIVNLREYTSGLPHLFLWNLSKKKCKFVLVKGVNDQLSIKQKLWLKYFMDNGADVEICYIRSKKKRISKENSD